MYFDTEYGGRCDEDNRQYNTDFDCPEALLIGQKRNKRFFSRLCINPRPKNNVIVSEWNGDYETRIARQKEVIPQILKVCNPSLRSISNLKKADERRKG